MAKQDVLDAINATIVPNGVQGITAQSLNNVLTMMTENAGEGGGSGDGALRVIVPEILLFGWIFMEFGEISPTYWEEVKLGFEALGYDLSEYDAVVKTSFEHNANVAQQILEKGKAGQGVSVVLDQTPYYPAAINQELQLDPEYGEMIEDLAMCAVQPAGLCMQYIKPTPEGEAEMGSEEFVCVFYPYSGIQGYGFPQYSSDLAIQLNLDGSLTFLPIEEEQPSSGSGVVTFYAPADNIELTSEYKAKNAEAFSAFRHGSPTTIVAMNGEEPLSTILPISVLSNDDSIYLGALQGTNDGFSIATIVVSSNGSVTINQ
jgi:hypothetical protein